jgi:DNA-directed RNA polymerase subunit RPC12/RpoP
MAKPSAPGVGKATPSPAVAKPISPPAEVKPPVAKQSQQKQVATTTQEPSTKPKVYVIMCKKCGSKISLGNQLRAGNYKCPRCMAAFKLSQAGKIEFLHD